MRSYSNSQQQHNGASRGVKPQFPLQGVQQSRQRQPVQSARSAMRATTSHGGHGNYPVFDSPYTRGPYGGSLDGGSVGGSVDGDSVSGYSWTEPSSVVGASWPGGQPQSYTVVKAVGGGGAGEAYIVTGKADGKQYVAKQIVCLGDQYKAAPASYALQETRLLFLLQHPHICRLVDFYPRSANFIIIMEFCEQGDLGRHINGAIRRGNIKFDVERVYTWWYQILDAIEYCHSKAVLHRDLKPKNIFIDAKLNVKVGDFGVSALVSSPPALERVGTVTYHAPEVQNSLNYSVKSDVWAIGVIMWETMQLRPPGGEPVRLTMINFQDIAPTYGQACRDLLVMHLADHPEQRDNAGALKAAMLQLLQESTQQTIASRAYMSSASVQSEAAKYADHMRPRMIQVPHGMVDTSDGQPQLSHEPGDVRAGQPNWDRASESSTYSGRDGGSVTSNDRSQAGTTASHVQDLFSPTEETPEVMELSSDLGIHVTAGTGGEFGAWKIALLPEHKPAAKSNTIAVGEYLWEINGKVIFGMPFQLISSLVKGNAAEVKVGVKKGLGLSIRHAVIRFDGDYSKLENTETPENGASLGASNVTQLSGPGSPIASAQTEQVDESTPALTDTESPSELQADASSTVDSLPSVASESNLQKAGSVDSDAEKSPSAGRSILQVPAEVARRSPLVPQRALAPSSSPPTSEAVSEPEGTFGSDAPALRLEPKGIRAINSPIMQSPITNPRNPAAAHMPTDIGSELHSESSSSVDTLKEISASKASRTKVMTRGRTTIAGDGQYEGELCDGKPFGMGTATWPQQGHTYVGEWRDGVMHGHGTATYLNGDRYDGEWSNGKRSGLGRYAHGSGDIYEGLWSNERKHGLGVDSFADGRGYRGEFLENKFAGVGIYFTVDGAVYQGDWFQGKAHGSGISTSTTGGQPAYVQYSHGNLTRSEASDPHEYEGKQARVEKLSRAAIAIALLARRVASLIQAIKLEPPMQHMEELEGQALRECLPPISGTSMLGKALVLLTGVRTIVQEDSSLVVTTFEESPKMAGAPPAAAAPGDIVYEVAARSCSWYTGMSLEDIMSHLQVFSIIVPDHQSQRLMIGLKSEGMPPWAKPDVFEWPMRRPGFVV